MLPQLKSRYPLRVKNYRSWTGSLTFLLNERNQKLYESVGFRMIEANIADFLRDHGNNDASWC